MESKKYYGVDGEVEASKGVECKEQSGTMPPHLQQCYRFKQECKRVNCRRLRSKSENCVGQHKEIEIRERD